MSLPYPWHQSFKMYSPVTMGGETHGIFLGTNEGNVLGVFEESTFEGHGTNIMVHENQGLCNPVLYNLVHQNLCFDALSAIPTVGTGHGKNSVSTKDGGTLITLTW